MGFFKRESNANECCSETIQFTEAYARMNDVNTYKL